MRTESDTEQHTAEAGPRLTVTASLPARGAVLITITGELDIATAPTLRRRMSEIRAAQPDQPLHLDLSDLLFCDLAGLRALHALDLPGAAGRHPVRITASGRCVDVLLKLCRAPAILGYTPPANHPHDTA